VGGSVTALPFSIFKALPNNMMAAGSLGQQIVDFIYYKIE
jgi:hypothetical protein